MEVTTRSSRRTAVLGLVGGVFLAAALVAAVLLPTRVVTGESLGGRTVPFANTSADPAALEAALNSPAFRERLAGEARTGHSAFTAVLSKHPPTFRVQPQARGVNVTYTVPLYSLRRFHFGSVSVEYGGQDERTARLNSEVEQIIIRLIEAEL